jgi:glutamine synthetase
VSCQGNEKKEETVMQAVRQAEYIWLDGATPTQRLRSKTRIVAFPENETITVEAFPTWSFDGSSTYQAAGHDSDLLLEPATFIPCPLRGAGHFLVLCEVLGPDGTPHATNTRARLRQVLAGGAAEHEPWLGFEQEYALLKGGAPLGFPATGFPAPQGPYYCGVGADVAFGRPVVEAHTRACIEAGLMIYGINAEVLPGQWEFQIGYRGLPGESADPLTVSDHLWLARWLLWRIAEDQGVVPTLAAKPVKGDWNGSGLHTNFSTRATRAAGTGLAALRRAVKALGKRHAEHISVYGDGLAERLTGLHETSSLHEFRDGVADRGTSVRIPRPVAAQGHGYLEDRRPAANADPYRVAARLLETVCGLTHDHVNGEARRGDNGRPGTGGLAPVQFSASAGGAYQDDSLGE